MSTSQRMSQPPVVARGTLKKFEAALNSESGKFKNLSQCLIGYILADEDEEEDHAGEMLLCVPNELDDDGNHIYHLIKGNNSYLDEIVALQQINLNELNEAIENVYTKEETEQQITETITTSISTPDSPVSEAINETIEEKTYSKEQVDDLVGDIGDYSNAVEAAKAYTDHVFEMTFL